MQGLTRSLTLFKRSAQTIARNKSSYVYEADKTFAQRWMTQRLAKIKEQQKFFSVNSLKISFKHILKWVEWIQFNF